MLVCVHFAQATRMLGLGLGNTQKVDGAGVEAVCGHRIVTMHRRVYILERKTDVGVNYLRCRQPMDVCHFAEVQDSRIRLTSNDLSRASEHEYRIIQNPNLSHPARRQGNGTWNVRNSSPRT